MASRTRSVRNHRNCILVCREIALCKFYAAIGIIPSSCFFSPILPARHSFQLIHEVQRMNAQIRIRTSTNVRPHTRSCVPCLRCIARTQFLPPDFDAQNAFASASVIWIGRKFSKRILDEVEIDLPGAIIRLLIWIFYWVVRSVARAVFEWARVRSIEWPPIHLPIILFWRLHSIPAHINLK